MSTQINVYNDGAEELVQRMRRTRILNMTEKYKKAIDSFSCIIYIANDTAGFAIFDAMTHLKKSPLYRQKVKKTANDANRIYDAIRQDSVQLSSTTRRRSYTWILPTISRTQ